MDVVSQQRGKSVAIIGLVLQFFLTAVMVVVWRRTESVAAMAVSALMASGLLLWLIALILFYCRQLERQETLELSEIASRSAAGSIFESADGAPRPAAARLAWIDRWVVPIFTLLFALLNVAMGVLLFRYLATGASSSQAALADGVADSVIIEGLLFTVGVAFVGFLFSRYATGMGSQAEYRPLRACGSHLQVSVLLLLAVAVGLGLAYRNYVQTNLIVAYVAAGVGLVLAFELALNFVMDIYRPRVPGQEQHLSFDSRLFNLVADPGRVGHSIAEAINYQFGFEVSKTWFYQLLSKALLPMLIVGVVIILGMTCVVMVPQGQEAVVTHWGKITRTLGPGMYLKCPWPIDSAERFNVAAIHEVLLGAGDDRSAEELNKTFVNGHEINVWTEEHGKKQERDFLVAVPPRDVDATVTFSQNRPPAVNIIKLVVAVQYVITDVKKYGYKYVNPEEILQCAAYREMVRYLASATLLDRVGGTIERPQAIMTVGRQAAAAELEKRIKAAVENDLGVRITYVGFQAIHPPSQAAKAYEEVLEAERRQDQMRYVAQAQANTMLAKVAGSPAVALKLAFAIRKYQELDAMRLASPQDLPSRIDQALKNARENLQTLDKELERDRLLGKLYAANIGPSLSSRPAASLPASAESLSDRQQLRLEYLAYIAQLEEIKASPAKFDLNRVADTADADATEILTKLAAGKPAALIAQASQQRWAKELAERALAETFERDRLAYDASPNIYMLDRWLDAWDEVLPGLPKYVFGVDRDKIELRMNLERDAEPMEGALKDETK